MLCCSKFMSKRPRKCRACNIAFSLPRSNRPRSACCSTNKPEWFFQHNEYGRVPTLVWKEGSHTKRWVGHCCSCLLSWCNCPVSCLQMQLQHNSVMLAWGHLMALSQWHGVATGIIPRSFRTCSHLTYCMYAPAACPGCCLAILSSPVPAARTLAACMSP
jgi:hypothetical protein